ncbi:type II toxin-antitoxin system RelE/ParE family toxin [Marinihelvus fidelis]|uniref:Type II toxin-antitoxin system RelE/ParE family toxin n=1 Tax=Marinihelvus fidelis TaxID=2613842 RepID=A0A5N0TC52_9GAMM|nr:type II toxin-antitoxin system RelE/ParE family toxin [Marinihelvus fidelis]
MTPVRFLASAREDIRREKAHYRDIQPELARRLQIAIEQAVELLAEQPLAMQEREFGIRCWPLETFPHGLLYRVEGDLVLVLALFHPSQAPDRWRDRVRT